MEENNRKERYIDLNKLLTGKDINKDVCVRNWEVPENVLNNFVNILNINPAYKMALKLTESHEKFFAACKDLKELAEDWYEEDLFYSLRLGYKFNGVPSRLVTVLQKAKDMYEYPNVAISMIDRKEFEKYHCCGMLNSDITISDVINNIWKTEVKLMSPYRRRVDHIKDVEVYVEHKIENGVKKLFDTVVLIPKDISDTIQDKDVSSIIYDTEKGLILNDIVLRTVNDRLGITKSDIDMRGSF